MRRRAGGPANGHCRAPGCRREARSLTADYCSPGCRERAAEQAAKRERYQKAADARDGEGER